MLIDLLPVPAWAIVGTGYAIALALVVRIVLQRREPTATLAWVLGVVLVPYLGALAYLVFGRRRLIRQVRRRRARAEAIERHLAILGEGIEDLTASGAPPTFAKPDEREMVVLTNRMGCRMPTVGNRVELFVDADASYVSLERAIEAAEKHINLEYYIFNADQTGRRFRDLLMRKAKAGVAVRLLTDGLGSFGIEDFMIPFAQSGAKFAEFQPIGLFALQWDRANFRNHRKIVVVDGRVAFTGGVNIGDEYTGRKKRVGPWRDSHLRIEGPAVYHLQEVFAEDWHYATGEDAAGDEWFPDQAAVGDSMVQVVASGPDSDTHAIQRIFFAAITSARSRVWLTTPYFAPDQAVVMALSTAALRGVDVRLLLPRRSDMRLVLHCGRSYYDELLSCGVRIYEYQPGILHAKTMVVDDTWATVGSANMDIRSFRLNFEVNAAVYGEQFARALGEVFLHDLRSSREITQEALMARGLGRRVVEGLARIFAPLL